MCLPLLLMQHFWNVFVVDALLGNSDRHNGNWGFLYDDSTKEASPAPIYDCRSCLLPQADEGIMEQVLVNEDRMNARIYQFPTSAIKLNGRKINYYDFLMSAGQSDCNATVQRIEPKINLEQINGFIDEVPYITKLQKGFYKRYITARFEQILKPAYDMVRSERQHQRDEQEILGGDKLENSESKEKAETGEKWAEMTRRMYKYYMVFETKNPGYNGAHSYEEFMRIVKELQQIEREVCIDAQRKSKMGIQKRKVVQIKIIRRFIRRFFNEKSDE